MKTKAAMREAEVRMFWRATRRARGLVDPGEWPLADWTPAEALDDIEVMLLHSSCATMRARCAAVLAETPMAGGAAPLTPCN
jgi:hypothetical protein